MHEFELRMVCKTSEPLSEAQRTYLAEELTRACDTVGIAVASDHFFITTSDKPGFVLLPCITLGDEERN